MFTSTLADYARTELGFSLAGVIPAAPTTTFPAFADWLEAGYHGSMAWLETDGRKDKRFDVRTIVPTAKTVLTLAYTYSTGDLPAEILNDPARGIFARYTWGKDYHKVLKRKLIRLIRQIELMVGHTIVAKAYVDTGPILERDLAQRAGLGFIGRNSQLINARYGSYLFLCEVIMDVECEPLVQRPRGGCRTCHACVNACPTQAIVRDRVIDARRCISFLTIEERGRIPEELRPLMKNRVYGCDICQEVCPWNATPAARATTNDWLQPELDCQAPPLLELARLTEASFLERFQGTPVVRAKRRGLLRNVSVALGNWGSAEAKEMLEYLSHDAEPVVRDHARWGLQSLQ